MIRSKDYDFELAYELQQDNCFGLTENAILPENGSERYYKPKTLIDQTLELIDPTPNIHTLFVQFNKRFFWNVLLPVEVRWSPRMTSCAGICTFHPRNRQCVIALSAPLLKLRPRKDLVETLLHEMIHGYLFLTNNNRDRDGHGPEFCKHMHRINKEAGTKITIYHSFHDEVKLYQQHWWRCNGPCQKRAPYFGTVRRAMNRAPGPSDFWWKQHQQTCGGQFVKIKEPENFKTKNSKKVTSVSKINNSSNNIFTWLVKPTPSVTELNSASAANNIKSVPNNNNLSNKFKKLGNGSNNVHGWGVGGPNTVNNSQKSNSPHTTSVSKIPKISSSGVLGGINTGQSNLLNKFCNINHRLQTDTIFSKKTVDLSTINLATKNPSINDVARLSEPHVKFVECPVCDNFISNDDINKHIDLCLTTENKKTNKLETNTMIKSYNDTKSASSQGKTDNFSLAVKRKNKTDTPSNKQLKLESSKESNCPVCNKTFKFADINEHLDRCLLEINKQDDNSVTNLDDINDKNETLNESTISINSTSSSNSSSSLIIEDLENSNVTQKLVENNVTRIISHNCLVCNALIPPEMSLTDHLEDCIGNVFKDDSSLSIDCDDEETSKMSSETLVDQNDKYPCPVCMQLILESFMNQHLDICLKST